ncbi:hypothetical protein ACFOYU_01300 [Microvirga sp. GCM10011540]|uniref:hypothetical protein n=1 Tax=Microvirga sp. GCM10011540 TaxID=3317338 RepID=UPI00360B6A42
MKHHLLGLFAASVTAPYLIVLLMILFGRDLPYDPAINDTALHGTAGLLVFGLPLFAASCLTALVLATAGWTSRSSAVFGGAVLGFCFIATVVGVGTGTFIGALSGAICGWIYWAIASAPNGREDRTMEGPDRQ